jgi:phosphoglycerate dehydrogenase-like enzyme
MPAQKQQIRSVLSTVRYQGSNLERLRAMVAPARFIAVSPDDDEAIRGALQEVDVAVLAADLDDRFLAAPNLKWVHCDHSGLNGSASPAVLEAGFRVTGSAGRAAPALAQHAFFFALSLAYDSIGLLDMQRKHVWRGLPGYSDRRGLWGKTIGIVGLGSTGTELAALAKAFGMHVLAFRKRISDLPPNVDTLYSADAGDDLGELLARSDLVVLTVRLTDQTYHLIGQDELRLMKPSAFLVNLARGPVLDEEALVAALRAGTIAGAGLDVFQQEPLPPESPVWDAPNLVITPHVTAEMPDLAARSLDIIEENFRRYRNGEPLLNQLVADDVFTGRNAHA